MMIRRVLLTLLLQCHVGTESFFFVRPGKIEKDQDYSLFYVGETLTLHCTKRTHFVGDVRFKYANRYVSNEYVTKVNETYARMDKPVTGWDFNRTTYQCVDGADDLIDSISSIYTDYPPQNASALQIIWLNKAALDISWGFGNTPFKNLNSEVNFITAEWSKNPEDENSWQLCYGGNVTANVCRVASYVDQWSYVTIRVNFTNLKRNDVVATTFNGTQAREHAKPNSVESVEMTALNSTTALVTVTDTSWKTLSFSITCFMTGGITFNTTGGQNEKITKLTGQTAERDFKLFKLRPHHTYQCEVRSKFELGYLSDLPDTNPSLLMPQDGTV